jgi:dihydroorotate dehydrogenase electron transfer subunit
MALHQLDSPVTGIREVARDMYVVTLAAPPIAESVHAGQFVMLGLSPGPLLRRPFSVYRVEADQIEVILKPVGAGTRQLLKAASVSCLGPLGRGFELPQSGRVALVSGGLGVAAMPLAARAARARGLEVSWVHGARSEAELCLEAEADHVIWATDDGSRGFHGNAVVALPDGVDQVLACGPTRMLAALAERRPDAQVAVETYMGCGTGVCLGCAVPKVAGGYDRACSEGPVYRASDVDWSAFPPPLHYQVLASPLAWEGREGAA